MRYDLLGLNLEEAEALLKQEGQKYVIKRYVSYKPYENPDSRRVLRIREEAGVYELLAGEFITNVQMPQG